MARSGSRVLLHFHKLSTTPLTLRCLSSNSVGLKLHGDGIWTRVHISPINYNLLRNALQTYYGYVHCISTGFELEIIFRNWLFVDSGVIWPLCMIATVVLGKILSVGLANAYRLCGETASVVWCLIASRSKIWKMYFSQFHKVQHNIFKVLSWIFMHDRQTHIPGTKFSGWFWGQGNHLTSGMFWVRVRWTEIFNGTGNCNNPAWANPIWFASRPQIVVCIALVFLLCVFFFSCRGL